MLTWSFPSEVKFCFPTHFLLPLLSLFYLLLTVYILSTYHSHTLTNTSLFGQLFLLGHCSVQFHVSPFLHILMNCFGFLFYSLVGALQFVLFRSTSLSSSLTFLPTTLSYADMLSQILSLCHFSSYHFISLPSFLINASPPSSLPDSAAL